MLTPRGYANLQDPDPAAPAGPFRRHPASRVPPRPGLTRGCGRECRAAPPPSAAAAAGAGPGGGRGSCGRAAPRRTCLWGRGRRGGCPARRPAAARPRGSPRSPPALGEQTRVGPSAPAPRRAEPRRPAHLPRLSQRGTSPRSREALPSTSRGTGSMRASSPAAAAAAAPPPSPRARRKKRLISATSMRHSSAASARRAAPSSSGQKRSTWSCPPAASRCRSSAATSPSPPAASIPPAAAGPPPTAAALYSSPLANGRGPCHVVRAARPMGTGGGAAPPAPLAALPPIGAAAAAPAGARAAGCHGNARHVSARPRRARGRREGREKPQTRPKMRRRVPAEEEPARPGPAASRRQQR